MNEFKWVSVVLVLVALTGCFIHEGRLEEMEDNERVRASRQLEGSEARGYGNRAGDRKEMGRE